MTKYKCNSDNNFRIFINQNLSHPKIHSGRIRTANMCLHNKFLKQLILLHSNTFSNIILSFEIRKSITSKVAKMWEMSPAEIEKCRIECALHGIVTREEIKRREEEIFKEQQRKEDEQKLKIAQHLEAVEEPKVKPIPKFLKDRIQMCQYYNDICPTPDLLKPLEKFNIVQKKRDSDADKTLLSQIGFSADESIKSAGLLQTQLHSQSIHFAQTYANATNTSVIRGDNELWDFWRIGSLLESICDPFEHKKDEQAAAPTKRIMPVHATITLNETPVFYLFEFPSLTAEKDSEEGKLVEQDIAHYDYLTIGKGRNRKTTCAEVQTVISLYKTRSTFSERLRTRENHAFASKWDMFDTFENLLADVHLRDTSKVMELSAKEQQRQMEELAQKNNFHNGLIIMERMLDNNVYKKQQKRFRGLIEQDPFRLDIHFWYTLDLLWVFKNTTTKNHPITSMDWNPFNGDILAVGYGKFFYKQHKNGFVFCWNIKNPTQPEREYYFTEPVTAVAFSSFKPTLIAAGLYDGTVTILDVTYKNVELLYKICTRAALSHEPIWQLIWLAPDEYSPENEYVVYTCEDGYVCRLMIEETNELMPFKLLKPPVLESVVQGVYQHPVCMSDDVPTTVSPAVLCIAEHPAKKDVYYIGTDDGAVHICSRNNLSEHLDVFLAHTGPVYCCQFSPFCSKLFLTAGADWCINIWAETIKEPLITLTSPMNAIEYAAWSPCNSTIIASVAGNAAHVWDIQRKTYAPSSMHYSPNNCRNTLIKFTSSGRNVVVADVEGNVHVYSLEDMPFPQFYPADILKQVVKNALLTRKELLAELDNLIS